MRGSRLHIEKDREGRSDKIHVEVRVPGSGFGMQETPEQKASTSVSTEEWAAIVRAVGNNTSTGA